MNRSFAPAADAPAPDPLTRGARGAAWDVLNRIFLLDGYASISLDEVFETVRMPDRDRRLCTNIVYTVLENLFALDAALTLCLDAEGELDPAIRNLLRLSACQIFYMDRVPESAAVNEAVNLARMRGFEGLTGFVNGVLRNIIRKKDEIVLPKKEDGLVAYLSFTYSMPEFLVNKLIAAYGEEATERILSNESRHRYITVRPNMMQLSDEDFEKLLSTKPWRAEKGKMPHAWYVSGTGDIAADEEFRAGRFSVQGEGSMLAAEAIGVKPGMNILDCCAAPGGKSAYLAERLQGTGRVQAWDKHEHRVELIQATSVRLRLYNIRPMVRDASIYREQMEQSMDAVLLDAPCSGTGTIGEKPDVRFRVKEDGIEALCAIQKQLLETCCRYVKEGGTFVYSTCSILPEENEEQIAAFLKNHPEFTVEKLPETALSPLEKQEGKLGLQLLQNIDGAEGFYIARMVRNKNA